MRTFSVADINAKDIAILLVLDEAGGFATGRVAELAGLATWGGNKRTGSGACRSWLRQLQSIGFVAPLDEQQPVAWVRTKAGSDFVLKLPSPAALPYAGGTL